MSEGADHSKQVHCVSPVVIRVGTKSIEIEKCTRVALVKLLEVITSAFPIAVYGKHRSIGKQLNFIAKLNDFGVVNSVSTEELRKHIGVFTYLWYSVARNTRDFSGDEGSIILSERIGSLNIGSSSPNDDKVFASYTAKDESVTDESMRIQHAYENLQLRNRIQSLKMFCDKNNVE